MILLVEHTGKYRYVELKIENVVKFVVEKTCFDGIKVNYWTSDTKYEQTFSYRLDEQEHLKVKGM